MRLFGSALFSGTRLLLAGIAATLAATLLFYPAYVFGVPMLDFATSFGLWLAAVPAPPLSEGWWQGFAEHLLNGSLLLPLLYTQIAYPCLPGAPIFKGALWGVALFVMQQYMFAPMRGLGLFSSQTAAPEIFLTASLAACVFYGALFGTLAGHCRAETEAAAEDYLPQQHPLQFPDDHRTAA